MNVADVAMAAAVCQPTLTAYNSQTYVPVLPTNTTITLAKAAVAANISTRRALVAMARTKEKHSVKAHMMPSLAAILLTTLRMIIELNGVRQDTTVMIAVTTRCRLSLE